MSTSMQDSSKLSEQEVQDEINTIMFEVSINVYICLNVNLIKIISAGT